LAKNLAFYRFISWWIRHHLALLPNEKKIAVAFGTSFRVSVSSFQMLTLIWSVIALYKAGFLDANCSRFFNTSISSSADGSLDLVSSVPFSTERIGSNFNKEWFWYCSFMVCNRFSYSKKVTKLKDLFSMSFNYSLRPKLSTKSYFVKQKCQFLMSMVQYKSAPTPLNPWGITITHQYFQMRYVTLLHYGLLDSYFFQATNISYSGFPWISGSPGASTELNFRGSGCDHKVLGVLESKNLKTQPNLTKKSQFSNNFWLLAPPKPQGRTQKPQNRVIRILPNPKVPMGTLGAEC